MGRAQIVGFSDFFLFGWDEHPAALRTIFWRFPKNREYAQKHGLQYKIKVVDFWITWGFLHKLPNQILE